MKQIEISSEFWTRLSPLLPNHTPSTKGGRPRLNLKKVFEGIIFIKVNKLPWKAAPLNFGSGTSLNDYYRAWAKDGFFHRLKEKGLLFSDHLINVDFDWDRIDHLNK